MQHLQISLELTGVKLNPDELWSKEYIEEWFLTGGVGAVASLTGVDALLCAFGTILLFGTGEPSGTAGVDALKQKRISLSLHTLQH